MRERGRMVGAAIKSLNVRLVGFAGFAARARSALRKCTSARIREALVALCQFVGGANDSNSRSQTSYVTLRLQVAIQLDGSQLSIGRSAIDNGGRRLVPFGRTSIEIEIEIEIVRY